MTKIKILKKHGKTYAYIVSGHTGKDVFGKDILCAALSSVAEAGVYGVTEVLKIPALVVIKEGYLKLEVDEDHITDQTQIIFDTIEGSFKGIMEEEQGYVKMEVKDEI